MIVSVLLTVDQQAFLTRAAMARDYYGVLMGVGEASAIDRLENRLAPAPAARRPIGGKR